MNKRLLFKTQNAVTAQENTDGIERIHLEQNLLSFSIDFRF